jgi:hypothetical protein
MISLFDIIVQLNKLLGGERFQGHLEGNLRTSLNSYQKKINTNQNLSPREIADIARNIVVAQYFNDRNHRTALLFCYFYYLINNRILRIKPYQFYAAIKFAESEFLNSCLKDSNHIFDVLASTKYSTCNHDNQMDCFEKMKDQTLHLHETLEKLSSSIKDKDKLIEKMHQKQRKSYNRFSKPIPTNTKKKYANLPFYFPERQNISALILGENEYYPSYMQTNMAQAAIAAPSPLTITKDETTGFKKYSEEESDLNKELFTDNPVSKQSESASENISDLTKTEEVKSIESLDDWMVWQELVEHCNKPTGYLLDSIEKARQVAPSPMTIRSNTASPVPEIASDDEICAVSSSSSYNRFFSNQTQSLLLNTIEEESIDIGHLAKNL